MKFTDHLEQSSDSTDKLEYKVINEASLSGLWKKSQSYDTGTITAWRYARDCGEGERYTRDELDKRNSELSKALIRLGFSVTRIRETFIENYGTNKAKPVFEWSFFVSDSEEKGNLKETLIKLGKVYEQDCITFAPAGDEYRYYKTNKCPDAFPETDGQRAGQARFGFEGPFYSSVRGRGVVFESVEVLPAKFDLQLKGHSINEIRAIYKATDKLISQLDEIDIND